VRFGRWRAEFNPERPHDALGGATPASRYAAPPRPMLPTFPEPEYPGHFETRWVSRSGTYKWQGRQLFLSQALHHEWVGFEETADGVWSVYFFDRLLARLDERDFKLRA
jgi:putative transposase